MTLHDFLPELSINSQLRLKFETVKNKCVFNVQNSTAMRVSEGSQVHCIIVKI